MPHKDKDLYKIGDVLETGSTIKIIIGATHNIIVYSTTEDGFGWETNDEYVNPNFSQLLEIFDRQSARIKAFCQLQSARHGFRIQLGRAFYNCARDPADMTSVERFKNQIKEMELDLHFHLRACYLAASFVSSAICGGIALVLFFYWPTHKLLWLSLFGGILGVFLSILFSLQRVQSVGKTTIAEQQLVDSQIRVLFGCLCGLAAYIFAKAGVAGSVFTNEEYGLMTFSIIAGFSERLIPSIISNLEKKTD